jgi:hypothetical protein
VEEMLQMSGIGKHHISIIARIRFAASGAYKAAPTGQARRVINTVVHYRSSVSVAGLYKLIFQNVHVLGLLRKDAQPLENGCFTYSGVNTELLCDSLFITKLGCN